MSNSSKYSKQTPKKPTVHVLAASLEEVTKAAVGKGMSYGQYVARYGDKPVRKVKK